VVILQGSDGFEQRGTKHPKQGHHNLHLRNWKAWVTVSSILLAWAPSMHPHSYPSPFPWFFASGDAVGFPPPTCHSTLAKVSTCPEQSAYAHIPWPMLLVAILIVVIRID
jgi:hypothetical protein